jgi:hypothetical protein
MLSLLAAAALASAADPAPWTAPIIHYVRSNIDGSEPEHVVQYRPGRTRIVVYKWVEKCKMAAYVTAEMDERFRDAKLFTAGKVARDGSQARFGTLTLDPAGPALDAAIDLPNEQIRERHLLRSRPFLLYDFDLSDLNVFLQEARPRADFAYELPAIWPAEGTSIFRDYGRLHAKYVGKEKHLDRDAIRFDLEVVGAIASTGTLWLDAAQGFIVEADLGLPNHLEYKDFRLRLDKVEAGGQAAWDALTTGHYANCPGN